jgi:tripartite ATP-independent transporter DctM subunit
MLKRGYSKELTTGCIAASGALSQLIPPSIIIIIIAMMSAQSVGRLFMAGIVPGIILATLYILYIAIRSALQPRFAPALPVEERIPVKERIFRLRAIFAPLIIVFAVLGSIFAGIASPTEAAAVGAVASIALSLIRRKSNWKDFRDVCYRTLALNCMVMWIIFGAGVFSSLAMRMHLYELVQTLLLSVPGGEAGIMAGIMLLLFVLGCFMDPYAVVLITLPFFIPVAEAMGWNLIWFLIIIVINMQTAFITPPFGYNLFYLKSIVPEDVSMMHIYRGIIPFVILQLICLIIIILFPQLALWLPGKLLG